MSGTPESDVRKVGKWKAEEDAALKAAVTEVGTDWKKVAAAVPGRGSQQCSARWGRLNKKRAAADDTDGTPTCPPTYLPTYLLPSLPTSLPLCLPLPLSAVRCFCRLL